MPRGRITVLAALAIIGLAGGAGLAEPETGYPEVKPEGYQRLIDGKRTDLFSLHNAHGMTVRITSYGARVVQLLAPDRNGNLGDVVMGFDTIEQLNKYVPSAGAIIGRYANRIAQGKITIDGTPYQLTINNGPNHLHGGTKGTRFVVFDAKPIDDHSIQFNYFFKAGEEGYPGDCALKVIYALTDDNALRITYDAVTDAPTVVNFSNHTNFNLTGRPGTNINDHVVTINANRFTPIGDNLIPNGEFRSVKGTPFDFTQPTRIGDVINTPDDQLKKGQQLENPPAVGGFDHNWILNKKGDELSFAARVFEPSSGRILEIYTTEPAIHFYSGNAVSGTEVGKGGNVYGFRSIFTMLSEHPDDSPNHADWPSTILRPGQWFSATTIYKFTTDAQAPQ